MDNSSWFCPSYLPCFHLESPTISYFHEELHSSTKPPIRQNKNTHWAAQPIRGNTLGSPAFFRSSFSETHEEDETNFSQDLQGGKSSESYQECLRHSPKQQNAAIYLVIIFFLQLLLMEMFFGKAFREIKLLIRWGLFLSTAAIFCTCSGSFTIVREKHHSKHSKPQWFSSCNSCFSPLIPFLFSKALNQNIHQAHWRQLADNILNISAVAVKEREETL